MKLLPTFLLTFLGLQATALLLTEQEGHHHHKKHHKKHKLRGKKISKEALEDFRTSYTVLRFQNEFCEGPYHAVELTINQTKAIHLAKEQMTFCGHLSKDTNSSHNGNNGTMVLSSCPGSGNHCPETCDTCRHGNFMRFPLEECSKGWIVLQGPAPTECGQPGKGTHGKMKNCKGVNTNDLGLVRGCKIPSAHVSQLSTKQKHKKGPKGTRKAKHHKNNHKKQHKEHHKTHHGKTKRQEEDVF